MLQHIQYACKLFPLHSGLEQKNRSNETLQSLLFSLRKQTHLCAAVAHLVLRVNINIYCPSARVKITRQFTEALQRLPALAMMPSLRLSFHFEILTLASRTSIWLNLNLMHLCKQAVLPPQTVSTMLDCSRAKLML